MNQQQFEALLTLGVKKRVSDIHFEVGYAPAYRVQRSLFAARMEPLKPEDTRSAVQWILGTSEMPSGVDEIDKGYSLPGHARFRCNIFRQRGSYGVVMRVIPYEIPSFLDLNLPKVMDRISKVRQGLVLVTGATGQGKSTSIASLIQHINQHERCHIITIEDPIEFVYPPGQSVVIQREVGSDTGSFRQALRSAMRQDPDVIMVGEMRDTETAETCLKAAETGHLVISTIHTMDVVRSVGRFMGMFAQEEQNVARGRLADALKAIVSLRLIPRADGTGLIPACEVLLNTSLVQQAIRDPSKTHELPSIIQRGSDELGTQTFDQHLYELCKQKLITTETALTYATSSNEIRRALSLGGQL